MASDLCRNRLMKEYKSIMKNPMENIRGIFKFLLRIDSREII